MHFSLWLGIPSSTLPHDLPGVLSNLLDPFCEENYEYDEDEDMYYDPADNPHGLWWDWWNLGGRWTGMLTDYDPSTDPLNYTLCNLCDGTGTRDWTEVSNVTPTIIANNNGCNGCHGTGNKRNWNNRPYEGDRQSSSYVLERISSTDQQLPYRFILKDYHIINDEYDYKNDLINALQANPDYDIVVIDYHS